MKIQMRLSKYFDAEYDGWSFNSYFRRKRIGPLLKMIEEKFNQTNSVNILDLGGTKNYWKIIGNEYLRRHNVKIVCLNLDPPPIEQKDTDSDIYSYVRGDVTSDIWKFLDIKSIDILHSNSVLEHVGDWSKMKMFAANIETFLGAHFIQTPNFWFLVEPHWITPFFQFLPKPIRVKLVLNFSLGHQKRARTVSEAVEQVESARLLDRKMMMALFPNSVIANERFLFMTKSLIAVKKET